MIDQKLADGGYFAHISNCVVVNVLGLERRIFKPDCVKYSDNGTIKRKQASLFKKEYQPLYDTPPLQSNYNPLLTLGSSWQGFDCKDIPHVVIGFTVTEVYLKSTLDGQIIVRIVCPRLFGGVYQPVNKPCLSDTITMPLNPPYRTNQDHLLPSTIKVGAPWQRQTPARLIEIEITAVRYDRSACIVTYLDKHSIGYKDSYLDDFLELYQYAGKDAASKGVIVGGFLLTIGDPWVTKNGDVTVKVDGYTITGAQVVSVSYTANGLDESATATTKSFLEIFKPVNTDSVLHETDIASEI